METAQKKREGGTFVKSTLYSALFAQLQMNIHIIYSRKLYRCKALHVTHATFSVDTAEFRISGDGKGDRNGYIYLLCHFLTRIFLYEYIVIVFAWFA